MEQHPERLIRPLLRWSWIGLWASAALLINALRFDLIDRFDILAGVFFLALWGGLIGLLIVAALEVKNRRGSRPSVLFFGVVLLTGVIFGLYGARIGTLTRFYALKSRYEAVVAEIRAGRDPGPKSGCRIEPGPPLRVAFPWPGGLLDNWCGVVYDPSGLVLKARRFRPDLSNFGDPDLQDVRRLFGGDLRSCEPLGGGWYFCCFT